MRFNIWTSSLTILIIPVLIGVIGCTSPDPDNDSEHTVGEEQAGHLPTHGEEGGEGEESGLQLAKNQTHDQVRNGARLTLRYDAQTHTFVGTVENITNQTLNNVRVEVHLSNGIELGPTTPTNLAPGQKLNIKLEAAGQDFDKWSAHPESG